jgi:hypothetical protein
MADTPDSINIDLTAHETLAISIALSGLNDAHIAKNGVPNPIIVACMEKLGKAVDEQVIAKMSPEDLAAGQKTVDEMFGKQNNTLADDLRKGFNVD